MRKIWIFFAVMSVFCWSVQVFASDRNVSFDAFTQEMQSDYEVFVNKNNRSYAKFKRDIQKKWAEFKDSTVTDWVHYNEDLSARSSVDFEHGFATFEVLLEDNTERAKAEAMKNLQAQMDAVNAQCLEKAGFTIEVGSVELYQEAKVQVVPNELNSCDVIEKKNNAHYDAQPVTNERMEEDKVPYKMKVQVQLPSDYLQKAAHKYRNSVYINGSRFAIKTNVVYAIIHTESYFNPFAKSHVPAYGLMQLVPRTGGQDAYEYVYGRQQKPSEHYLYNPQNNILLGTAYFSKIKNVYFKGIRDEESAYIVSIAAYNTGIGNVAKALTGTKSLKNVASTVNKMTPSEVCAVLLQKLPYDETKKYLENILNRSAMYRGI